MNLGTSLKATLSDSELPGVLAEMSELAMDSLLNEGVLRDVPIISTIIAIGKTAVNVSQAQFAKKVVSFLVQIAELDRAQRKLLVDKWEREKGFGAEIGEVIIELLDRVEAHRKPQCLANAFKAYAHEDISYEDLQRINAALVRFLFCDLEVLDAYCKGVGGSFPVDHPAIQNLTSIGLIYQSSGFGGPLPEITALGLKFRTILY